MATHEATEVPTAGVSVPLEVRIGFAHASLQWIADRCGADLLHVKGAALDPTLVPARGYSDADVLARAGQVQLLLDELWRDHTTVKLGGVECAVPSRDAQAALLLLHAARGGNDPKAALDVEAVWTTADEPQRDRIRAWVDRLDAGLGFSVITGTLEEHRDDPAYDLWRVAARGGTRVEEWQARVRAARGLRGKLAVAARSVLVNVEHLTLVRGRPVSRSEILAEFFGRPARGLREQVRRRSRQRRGDVG